MPRLPLAQYLFTRLRSQGVHAVHGVPGDFTLKALDYLPRAGLKWIGNCNELNAGYAADGYARIRGLGALFTTYGVGELSAINAVAGSFAESVPVVHIVGTPQRRLQDARANVHHTLGDGRPRVFAEMHEKVTVAQANLVDERTAPEMIDRTIEAGLRESKPVYIELPCDMVTKEVDSERLDEPLCTEAPVDDAKQGRLVDDLIQRIYAAKQPLILVDSGDGVRQYKDAINALVERSEIPTLAMPSGNGMVSHQLSNHFGVHSGPVGQIDTMPFVTESDLVLAFGPMFSDTQTLGWKVVPDADKLVTLGKNYVSDHATTTRHRHTINLRTFLARLTEELDPSRIQTSDVSSLGDFRSIQPQPPAFSDGSRTEINNIDDAPIDQTNFYLRLNPYLQPNDIVLLGNATPILGGRDLVLPPGAQIIASGQWFSIGHMLPAALGAGLAQQQATPMSAGAVEKHKGGGGGRTILLDGDGSFQVTAQELATIIRYRVPITIFLINNAGYAYERQIHGMHEDYNDLAMWDYTRIPFDFGGAKDDEEYPIHTHRIHTWRDLTELLSSESFCNSPGLQFVDVRMDKFDIPEKFKVVFQRAGEQLG
ncbi:hypothetical protein LTR99_004796 [Exophiala xenobiotica]|uniref:Pyruvate decarboxylase n=1 Tax=Vermiconidia calcicola TaxID=1690605 RepID=A0AAV9QCR8_9PEZI|nr:hypothetical protein LTR96_008917 [Exophiala xenobiotica]KAK5540077.1 hypothetical protein LTR25_003782 [Vermiconidia calcicola]KAK5543167.1 hypothetical protein LTR23_004930 [Chaetothyriales sp. CCFEE 6169]KAK5304340.1 hypothetical protein LTR99_004796 [Exophiala xenobiotica]KAK5338949.1 hypothetical protein LTR98_005349 [Exophiala xenobiotica]